MFWSNIRFICRHYLNSTKSIYGYFVLIALSLLLAPVLSVYLPRVVVQAVTEGWATARLAAWVSGIVGILAVLNLMYTVGNFGYEEKSGRGRLKLGLKLEEIMVSCDYALTEDPKWQMQIEEAGNVVFSDHPQKGITGMTFGLRDFIINALGIFTFSAILSTLHPGILAVLAVTSLIPGVAANRASMYEFNSRDKWMPYDKRIRYVYDKTTTSQAGKEIRLYKGARFFLKSMEEAIMNRMGWVKRVALRRLGADGVGAVMLMIQNGAAVGWIAYEIIQGQIGLADFTLYAGSVIQFTNFVNRFVQGYATVKKCSLDVQLVRDCLQYMPKEQDESTSLPAWRGAPEIRFEHVTFAYPGSDRKILDDVSFCIGAGEKIALVGGNGAGKTTMVKLLCGFYRPDSGRIWIHGQPLEQMGEMERMSLFSAVFQDMLVLPFTVLENVAGAGAADVDKVRSCLEKAGLSRRFPNLNQFLVKGIEEGAENLSGGEQQKLLLARALYKDAPVLILDEPTAALDPLAESELYERYNRLTQEKTSLFISHRLASTRFCDRIFLFADGRVAEEGTHEELLALGGQYARMFHEQSKYYQEGEVVV